MLGVIEEAERAGQLKPGQTVIEATSGNTGIGLAMVCAQKGYPLVITMAETFSVERHRCGSPRKRWSAAGLAKAGASIGQKAAVRQRLPHTSPTTWPNGWTPTTWTMSAGLHIIR